MFEFDEEIGNVYKFNSRLIKEYFFFVDGFNDFLDEDVSYIFELFFNIDKSKGLVDGFFKFFILINKRIFRVFLNFYNVDLVIIFKYKKMND